MLLTWPWDQLDLSYVYGVKTMEGAQLRQRSKEVSQSCLAVTEECLSKQSKAERGTHAVPQHP